jgi:hypothetical protein
MNIRNFQSRIVSAAAALLVSAFFIGAAVSPVALQPSVPTSAQQSVA